MTYSDPDINLFNLSQIEALPALADQMQVDTVRDPLLSKVIQYVRDGRPSLVPDELKLYRIRRNKPSIECNSFFWGIRVLIPSQLPYQVKAELYRDHLGVMPMKMLAGAHVWWPGLDLEFEYLVKGCLSCQSHKHTPRIAPLHPRILPTCSWRRIHVDFAGPFLNRMFLIAIDAHSKWPEVKPMSSTTVLYSCQHMLPIGYT